MRLIDADALIEKCGEWYVEEGPEDGFIGTIKQLLESQPIVHVSDKDADTISRKAAIEDVRDGVYTGSKIRRWLKSLPSAQPERPTGEWIQKPRYEDDEYPDAQPNLKCPFCGYEIDWYDMGNYCARCGADLKGGAE